jgi:hypothetical protein
VGIGTVDRALSLGMFTKAYLDHSKKVYLLKSEVDYMVGYDDAPLTSKKVQARMAAFRRQQDVDKMHGSLDNLPAESIEREVSHVHFESEKMKVQFDLQTEQEGKIIGMYWEACRFYEKFTTLPQRLNYEQLALFDLPNERVLVSKRAEWVPRLAVVCLLIYRWYQFLKGSDFVWKLE